MTDTNARPEPPQLVDYKIEPDHYSESPRSWDNLGTLLSWDRSPGPHWDGQMDVEWIDTFREYGWGHTVDQIREDTGAIVVVPVASNHDGIEAFPYAESPTHIDGVIFDTPNDRAMFGVPDDELRIRKMLTDEVDVLNIWMRGEVYQYVIVNEDLAHVGGCGGFYDPDYCEQEAIEEAMSINRERIREWKRQLDSWDNAPDGRTMKGKELVGLVTIEFDGIPYELTDIRLSPVGDPIAELRKVKQ